VKSIPHRRIGHGAIPTEVEIVQGDEVGDGPLASQPAGGNWKTALSSLMKLRGTVKFPLKTDKTRVEWYSTVLFVWRRWTEDFLLC